MIVSSLRLLRDLIANTVSRTQLSYIIEGHDWSITQDGISITRALNTQRLFHARTTHTALGLTHQLVHFGSINTFFNRHVWKHVHPSNTLILTWFHVVPDDPRLPKLVKHQDHISLIHTSCEKTKEVLLLAGIDAHRVVVIPLGVDTSLFTPVNEEKKRQIRKKLGIGMDRLVIGSFQKDGVGWGDGMEPKLIKGPDLFVETIKKLRDLNPHILLTGPARGYVKDQLEKNGIEYTHRYFKTFEELPLMYHALDLYVIASRIEGGPKAILEAWASSVPVVSTRVGMVSDIGHDKETVRMCDMDAEALATTARELLLNEPMRKQLVANALRDISQYDWREIVNRYMCELYGNLIHTTAHRPPVRKQ